MEASELVASAPYSSALDWALRNGLTIRDERLYMPGHGFLGHSAPDGDGYVRVTLPCPDRLGFSGSFAEHVVVCIVAHGRCPDDKDWADHVNRDPSDNRPSNLRWATKSENALNTDRSNGTYADDRFPYTCAFRMDAETRDMLDHLRLVLHKPKRDILSAAIAEVWQRITGARP